MNIYTSCGTSISWNITQQKKKRINYFTCAVWKKDNFKRSNTL